MEPFQDYFDSDDHTSSYFLNNCVYNKILDSDVFSIHFFVMELECNHVGVQLHLFNNKAICNWKPVIQHTYTICVNYMH